jgi:hypothetical protein
MDGVSTKDRALLMVVRQALIMVLGGIEDYLGMPRSVQPKRKREKAQRERGVSGRRIGRDEQGVVWVSAAEMLRLLGVQVRE